jgi:hypothetical protein
LMCGVLVMGKTEKEKRIFYLKKQTNPPCAWTNPGKKTQGERSNLNESGSISQPTHPHTHPPTHTLLNNWIEQCFLGFEAFLKIVLGNAVWERV